MAASGSGAPVESEGDAIAEPAPAVTGDVVEEAAPASNDENDDEKFSPSVIPVPDLPFPDGQSDGELSETSVDLTVEKNDSSSDEDVPLVQKKKSQPSRRKSLPPSYQEFQSSEDDDDSDGANCPPAAIGDESENEVEAGDFEAYDPLGLNWEVGGDDLPEPVHVVEDFDGKPSWDPSQPPSAFTCFVMLFPIVLLASVAAETNRYGKWLEQTAISQCRRPKVWVDTDVDELCRFFGLIIVRKLHTTSFFYAHLFFAPKPFFVIAHILLTFQAMSMCKLNNQRMYSAASTERGLRCVLCSLWNQDSPTLLECD